MIAISLDEKQCVACGAVKPLTEFARHKGYPDGHTRRCKACIRVASREYYRRRKREEVPVIPSKYVAFTCAVCGREFRYRRTEIEYRKRTGRALPKYCSDACNGVALSKRNRKKASP